MIVMLVNKWTYNSSDHLMVDPNTLIALAYMMYSLDTDTCKLHLNNVEVLTTLYTIE